MFGTFFLVHVLHSSKFLTVLFLYCSDVHFSSRFTLDTSIGKVCRVGGYLVNGIPVPHDPFFEAPRV